MGYADEIVQKIHKLICFEGNHCANNVIQTSQEFLQVSHLAFIMNANDYKPILPLANSSFAS
jgi:hypothetical protein